VPGWAEPGRIPRLLAHRHLDAGPPAEAGLACCHADPARALGDALQSADVWRRQPQPPVDCGQSRGTDPAQSAPAGYWAGGSTAGRRSESRGNPRQATLHLIDLTPADMARCPYMFARGPCRNTARSATPRRAWRSCGRTWVRGYLGLAALSVSSRFATVEWRVAQWLRLLPRAVSLRPYSSLVA
jgi:hypothetical protein